MRLQSQLTIAFVVVMLVPIASVTLLARRVISDQSRREFRHDLERARDEVDREFRRARDEVRRAAARLAEDDELIGRTLVKLARGPLDDDAQQDLAERVERDMPALGFDVLELVDERGTVLAAGHFPGRAGDSDPEALRLARARAGQAQLSNEDVMRAGRRQRVLAIEASRIVLRSYGDRRAQLTLVAGRLVESALLDRLSSEHVRLLALDGSELYPLKGAPPANAPQTLYDLEYGDGTCAARVEISLPDEKLRVTLARINVAAAGVGVLALFLAAGVGGLVARRWSGPLERLADGARAVARGRLDTQVRVGRRDELGELALAFNTMTQDLTTARQDLVRAERVAAWREIAQRIAHEIKNPLTPIQMAIETLQRAQTRNPEKFEELFAESARTILDEVARLKHIVAEFSSFARMPPPTIKSCVLNEVVESALRLYVGAVPIERELDPSAPLALVDRDQITQVLLNLVENAREAVSSMPAGGRIQVRTRPSAAADRIELEVADTGPGLSDEAHARLFTPYFTTKARGTGLGLAIVHRIVSDHGGEIRVGGEPGRGAVFTISLPRG